MKNNIDSNFAIAILALVSACVGFAFWINQNLNDLSTGSSEYQIVQSSQVNKDAGKKIAAASEYKLFEVTEMGVGIMIKEQNYDDILYEYQKDEFGERVFVYSKSVVGSSPCTADSFGVFSFVKDVGDGPYKGREPRVIVNGRSLYYAGPHDYCLGDQDEENIKARHRSVLDDISSGKVVSILEQSNLGTVEVAQISDNAEIIKLYNTFVKSQEYVDDDYLDHRSSNAQHRVFLGGENVLVHDTQKAKATSQLLKLPNVGEDNEVSMLYAVDDDTKALIQIHSVDRSNHGLLPYDIDSTETFLVDLANVEVNKIKDGLIPNYLFSAQVFLSEENKIFEWYCGEGPGCIGPAIEIDIETGEKKVFITHGKEGFFFMGTSDDGFVGIDEKTLLMRPFRSERQYDIAISDQMIKDLDDFSPRGLYFEKENMIIFPAKYDYSNPGKKFLVVELSENFEVKSSYFVEDESVYTRE